MPTSELSDALNPNHIHHRATPHVPYASPSNSHLRPVLRPNREHVPHRSELELAIAEPDPPPPTPAPTAQYIPGPPPGPPPVPAIYAPALPHPAQTAAPSVPIPHQYGRHPAQLVASQPSNFVLPPSIHPPPPRPRPPAVPPVVHDLVRALVGTKQTVDLERKRRSAWEHEQEARLARRDAEVNGDINDLRQELATLKACVGLLPYMDESGQNDQAALESAAAAYLQQALMNGHSVPAQAQAAHNPTYLPSYPSAVPQTGGLAGPVPYHQPPYLPPYNGSGQPVYYYPVPAQQYPEFVQGSSANPLPPGVPPAGSFPPVWAVQASPPVAHTVPAPDYREDTPGSPSPARSLSPRPSPAPLSPPDSPVRPARTLPTPEPSDDSDSDSSGTRSGRRNRHDKSIYTIQHAMRVHVLRMMQIASDRALPDAHPEGAPLAAGAPVRFVWDKTARKSAHNAEMKRRVVEALRRDRYRRVPAGEFRAAVLERAFDQCYTTLRTKFRAQRDAGLAEARKVAEARKAARKKGAGRKKAKLQARTEAHSRGGGQAALGGALLLACVSSEESAGEAGWGAMGFGDAPRVVVVHPPAWRSRRLGRFMTALDEVGEAGPKKEKAKERRTVRKAGEPRAEPGPPEGVSRWMVSKRWRGEGVSVEDDPAGLDLSVLGVESEDGA